MELSSDSGPESSMAAGWAIDDVGVRNCLFCAGTGVFIPVEPGNNRQPERFASKAIVPSLNARYENLISAHHRLLGYVSFARMKCDYFKLWATKT